MSVLVTNATALSSTSMETSIGSQTLSISSGSLGVVNLLWGLLLPTVSSSIDMWELSCIDDNNLTISKNVLHTLINENYDKYLIPGRGGANVTMELVVQTVSEISEITASFTSDILLRYSYLLAMVNV